MGPAAGNGTEAARAAGYNGSPQVLGVQSTRLLKKANVLAAIEERRQGLTTQSIADAKERREILTRHARNTEDLAASARAVDILNKMDGLYIQKVEHSGAVAVEKARVLRALPDDVLHNLLRATVTIN